MFFVFVYVSAFVLCAGVCVGVCGGVGVGCVCAARMCIGLWRCFFLVFCFVLCCFVSVVGFTFVLFFFFNIGKLIKTFHLGSAEF